MASIMHPLVSALKGFRDALLAPAEDPRELPDGDVPGPPTGRQNGRPGPEQRRIDLEAGFSVIGSETGLKALHELVEEYRQLQPVLGRKRTTDPLSVVHIPALVELAYDQGLSVLDDALELAQAIRLPEGNSLEVEVSRLQEQIEGLQQENADDPRLAMWLERLTSYRELHGMIGRQQLRLDELLHQCGRCQASLQRTRIELAAIRANSSGANVDAVTDTLRKTISQARGVQEELQRLGL